MICCLIPDDGGPSFLWGTWLALGYAGCELSRCGDAVSVRGGIGSNVAL